MQGYTQLYAAKQGYAHLYRAIRDYTEIYTAIQGYTCTERLHSNTKLYTDE